MVQKYLDILLHKMEVSIRLRNFSAKQANSQRLGVTLLWEMFTSQKRDKTQSCYHAPLPLTHILITRGTSCISFERQIKTNSQSCKGKESTLCFYLGAVIGSASELNIILFLLNKKVFTCGNVTIIATKSLDGFKRNSTHRLFFGRKISEKSINPFQTGVPF